MSKNDATQRKEEEKGLLLGLGRIRLVAIGGAPLNYVADMSLVDSKCKKVTFSQSQQTPEMHFVFVRLSISRSILTRL